MANNYNAPCQHCGERKVDENYNCHSHCTKYIEFSKQLDEMKKIKQQEIQNKGIIIESVTRCRKGNRVII